MNRWKWLLLGAVPVIGVVVAFAACKQYLAYTFAGDGHVRFLSLVVKLGANVNGEYDKSYPLISAIKYRQEATIRYLLSKKANVNVRDQEKLTPLMWAMDGREVEISKELIAAGAGVNAEDDDGRTALRYAIRAGSDELVALLLQSGADTNIPDMWGTTPLMHAAKIGNEKMVRLLLQSGADMAARDINGHTAFEFIPAESAPSLVPLLRKVYFVPLGDVPMDEIQALVSYYRTRFALEARVLPRMRLDDNDLDLRRGQWIAENLVKSMDRANPEYANNTSAILIGITSEDMYPTGEQWQFCFGWRSPALHSAVVSSARLNLHYPGEPAGEASLSKRLRKVVTKDIGMMYFWKRRSLDPRSVMYDGIAGIQELDRVTEEFLN